MIKAHAFCSSVVALFCLCISISAQAGISHYYGSTQTIKGNADVFSSDITTDAGGNVFVVGRFKGGNISSTFYDGTTDFDPGPGTDNRTPLTSLYAGDAYVTKINADGSYAWTQTFGNAAGSAYADGVAVDSNGNVYITGSYVGTMDFDPGPGTAIHTSSGPYHRFTVKLHADGSYAWMLDGLRDDFANSTSGSGRDAGNNLKIDGNDDIYLVGYSAPGSFDFDLTTGVDTITVTGGYAAYVSKYHADGSYAWTRVYPAQDPSDYVQINDLTFDGSGNILLLGKFDGASSNPTVDVDPGAGTVLVSKTQTSCYVLNFVAPLDTSGNYGGWVLGMPLEYNSFALDSNDNLYLTGRGQDGYQSPFKCGDYQVGGNYGAMLTKIIGHTAYGWTKRFETIVNGSGAGMKVMVDTTDNVYVAGGSGYAGYDNASSDPAYVARFTPYGIMSWLKIFGSGGMAHATLDKDNNIYGTNPFSVSADFDPSAGTDIKTPTGALSVYLTKFVYDTSNIAPVAYNGNLTTEQNTAASGMLTASDAENDPLTYSIVTNGSKGKATITDTATGAFTYRPSSSSSGTDSFTFVVNDGQLNSNTATVTITINPAPPGTDLVMSAIGKQTSADPGKYAYISNTVKNIGADASSGSFKVALYLSTDSTITTADTYLGYRTIFTALKVNATSTATTGVKIPTTMAPGNYYMGAIADYQNTIAETNEGNNTISMPFLVSAPDLVVSSLSGPSEPAAPSSDATVTGTVSNQGPSASSFSYLGLYLSTDSTITTGDTYLGNVIISGTASGASRPFSKSVRLPAGLSAGAYYVGAIADYKERVTEMDEGNNIRSAPITVFIPTPDLIMTGISVPTIPVAPATSFSVSGTAKNIGTGASTTTYVGFYSSTDSTITTGDTLLGYVYAGRLAVDASKTVTKTVKLPSGLGAGTYYLGAIADYNNKATEIDEGNNSLSGNTVTVLP